MRMLREPHIKPHPVVGKCATRTFSSNPSVVKLRSEESSLKRPMLREPHIKGVRPGYSRAYISLYYVRAQSHALLARIMPARDIETRVRSVSPPIRRGARPPGPPALRGCCTGTPALCSRDPTLGCWMGRFTLVVWEGWGFPCSEWDTGGIWAAHSGPSPPASSIDCLPIHSMPGAPSVFPSSLPPLPPIQPVLASSLDVLPMPTTHYKLLGGMSTRCQ